MRGNKAFFNLISLNIICFIFILFAFNEWNGDRDTYESIYYADGSIKVEVGFEWLSRLFHNYGYGYQEFQIFIAFFTLLFLFIYANKHTNNVNVFLIIYVITFFPLDYVLIRNFFSFSICLLGFCFIENGKKGRGIFILFVLVASLIHQSALCFLVFCFMPFDRYIDMKIFSKWIALFYILFFGLSNVFFNFLGVSQHLTLYSTTYKSAIFNCIVHFLLSISIVFFVKKNCNSEKKDIFIINFNLLSLVFLPLYFESEIFLRLIRLVLFFNFCYLSDFLFLRKGMIFSYVYIIIFLVYSIAVFLIPTLDLSVYPLFSKNFIFKEIF